MKVSYFQGLHRNADGRGLSLDLIWRAYARISRGGLWGG
ncbi:MAG: hypothetical protein ACI80I_003028, partial [Akkermansiaceae bacterium]